jgi:hypothetical protein
MQCPKCNAELKEGAVFCHVCGFKLPEAPQADSPYPKNPQSEAPKSDEKIDAKTFTDVKSDEVIANVKSGNLFKRIFAILFAPSKEWTKIAAEKPKVALIIFGYLLILGLVALSAKFLGHVLLVFRYGDFAGGSIMAVGVFSVIRFAFLIATPVIAALIINAIAPAFKVEKNFGKMLQLTAYSFTPVFISWTLFLIPAGPIYHLVQLLGLYGILILLLGYKKILVIPANKQVGYFFTMAGILYGVYYVLYWTVELGQTPFLNFGYNAMMP